MDVSTILAPLSMLFFSGAVWLCSSNPIRADVLPNQGQGVEIQLSNLRKINTVGFMEEGTGFTGTQLYPSTDGLSQPEHIDGLNPEHVATTQGYVIISKRT
jgi:hypothetical protein